MAICHSNMTLACYSQKKEQKSEKEKHLFNTTKTTCGSNSLLHLM